VCIMLSQLLSHVIKIEDCEVGSLICRVVLQLSRSRAFDNGVEEDISTYGGECD